MNVTDAGASRVGAPFRSGSASFSDDNRFARHSESAEWAASIDHPCGDQACLAYAAARPDVSGRCDQPFGPCRGRHSCSMAVGAILPQGSSMTVWFKGTAGITQSVTLHGRAGPG
ncbi:DddA-like double-stranded DNA deaminase toxin [Spongiactinospora rosea]